MTTSDRHPTAAGVTGNGPAGGDRPVVSEAAGRSGNGHGAQVPATPEAGVPAAPFAGLGEAAATWLPETIAQSWTESVARMGEAPWPAAAMTKDAWDYWVDTCQRTVLFWDVLRQRGNQAIEHYKAGKPPVLVFDYEMVMDGRRLERPVNYALVRIKPGRGETSDPAKRPFVIVDPRAGHGPGIGGFKEQSEVGVALRAGHPVYFVTFFPEPEPGQTIEDIGRAEVLFVRKVRELHPEADGKPVVVGNCQAGWAIMMMAAAAPDDVGIVAVAGSPLSYWAGREGVNPMRYTGGLLGGTWLTSLMGDLGNGKFDGAHLVSNFESLNPANTLWTKPYNLYSKVDTEESRYLGFEKWWSGYFFTTKEEMRFITDELFVGNKLTRGTIQTSDRRRIDLRNIRAPIVVIASWGDDITPPPQALNWIADLYETVDEIRANEQVIVYTLDQRIGHLGIFVSAKVAEKQHAEIVNTIDLIGSLPPGLYEMVIEERAARGHRRRPAARQLSGALRGAHGGGHPGARRRARGRAGVRDRGADLGGQRGPLRDLRRALGANAGERCHGRGAARDAPAPARAVHGLGPEPDGLAAQGDG